MLGTHFFGKFFMAGNMLHDKMVNKFEINKFNVPCVWHTFRWSNVALRLINWEPENNNVCASSSSNSSLENIGGVRSKWASLAKPFKSSSVRPSLVAFHYVFTSYGLVFSEFSSEISAMPFPMWPTLVLQWFVSVPSALPPCTQL